MIGKRLSTIVFLIAVAVLASAQTTKSMNKDNKEKIPLYSIRKRNWKKSPHILNVNMGSMRT